MGFKKMFKASSPATVTVAPPTVTETLESDSQADYAQQASRKRGLLSTILSNRNNRSVEGASASAAGNKTLG